MTPNLASSEKTLATTVGKTEFKAITVRLYPNPFDTRESVMAIAPGGMSITEVLLDRPLCLDDYNSEGMLDIKDEIFLKVMNQCICFANGKVIEYQDWATVVPSNELIIYNIPGNNNTLRIIGSLIIIVVALWLGDYYGGVQGLASLTGASIAAGVSVVGNLLLNHFIPPTIPKLETTESKKLQFVNGATNQIGAFTPVPAGYGLMRYLPPIPMTALPFTELVGDDQYIRVMYVLGYGPLSIGGVLTSSGVITQATSLSGTPIRIADVPITSYVDYEFQIGTPAQVTLFTDSVSEEYVNIAIPRTGATPSSDEQTIADGSQNTRATATNTDEVSLDVFFPALFCISKSGNTRLARVLFTVECRITGAGGAWTMLDSAWYVQGIERDPVRQGKRYILPSRAQWDIRLTRVSTFIGRKAQFFTDGTWTALRSIKTNQKPFDVPNVVVMALRMKASEQLGGRVERLSIEATRVVQVWDGSVWAAAATRNPAWAYADVFTGFATKEALATSYIDTAALLSWANWCASNNLYCDMFITDDGTVLDRARDVASTGLGSWAITPAAKISIVRDQALTPKMLIGSANVSQFESEYSWPDLPHALRVQFIDNTIWEQTERIVYADTYNAGNATRFDQLQTVGVTDPDQAWKIARYHLAQIVLRPERFYWQQDIGQLILDRGDAVEIQSDVISVGLVSGRIKTVAGNNLSCTVDETLYMTTGTNYALKIQKASDGSIVVARISTVDPSTTNPTFLSAVSGVAAGDFFTHGIYLSETIKAKVIRIEPQAGLKARIMAVPAADNIFDAWTGGIPAYVPQITVAPHPDFLTPPPPTILSVTANNTTSLPDSSGLPQLRLNIAFYILPGYIGVTVEAEIRRKDTFSAVDYFGPWVNRGEISSEQSIIQTTDIEPYSNYQVRIRSRKGQLTSAWSATTNYYVDGLAFAEAFAGKTLAGSILGNPSLDIARRYSSGPGLRPLGWFLSGAAESIVSYIDSTRFGVSLINTTGVCSFISQFFPLNPDTKYELLIIAKSDSSHTISLGITTVTTELAPGKLAINHSAAGAYADAEIANSTGSHNTLTALALTTSYAAYTRTFTPPVSSKYGSLILMLDVEVMDIQSIWLRDASTFGAKSGVNLSDDLGTLLYGMDIRNDLLLRQAIEFINSNASFDVPRLDGGALEYPAAGAYVTRPAAWYQSNANANRPTYLDATRDEVVLIAAHTYANAPLKINQESRYEFVALIRAVTGTATVVLVANEYDTDLLPSGTKFISQGASAEPGFVSRTRGVTIVTDAAVGTTYKLVTGVFIPTATAKWFSLQIQPTVQDIWVEWAGVRDLATWGATAGLNLYTSADVLINDVDILNDAVLGTALGGSLAGNPSLDFAQTKVGGSGQRPIAWFLSGNAESELAYTTPATRDTITLTRSGAAVLSFLSTLIQVTDKTEYEIIIVARSAGSNTIGLNVKQHTAQLASGKYAFIDSIARTFTDAEVAISTGSSLALSNLVLTGAMAAYVRNYVPTAGTLIACIEFVFDAAESMEIDSIWIRDKATIGSTLGVDFKNSASRILADIDVQNDALVKRSLSFINDNSGFDFPRADTLSGSYKVRPANWYCSTSATDTNRPVYVSDATRDEVQMVVGQRMTSGAIRINPGDRYELSALVKALTATATIAIYIEEYDTDALTQGQLYIGVGTGETGGATRIREFLGVSTAGITTTYTLLKTGLYVPTATSKWFSMSIISTTQGFACDWAGIRSAATYGANVGTHLFDNAGNLLLDVDVENDQAMGSILGSSLTSNPALDFSRRKVGSALLRPVGWFLRSPSESNLSYSNGTRDSIDITGPTIFASIAFPVELNSKYEIIILARSDTNNTITVQMSEHTARLAAGKLSFITDGADTFTDAEIAVSTGTTGPSLAVMVLTGSMVAYVREYVPTAGKVIACLSIYTDSGEHIEIDQIWVRDKSTFGARAGTNLTDAAGNILLDVDVRNDQLIGSIFGGSLVGNPSLDFAREKVGVPGVLRPIGWFLRAANEGVLLYSNVTRDSINLTHAGGDSIAFLSTAFPINPRTEYEILIVARSSSSSTIPLYMNERSTILPNNKLTFMLSAAGTFNDTEILNSVGSELALASLVLTGSMTGYSRTYIPSANQVVAALMIVVDTSKHIEIDSIWIRDRSTIGAKIGTDTYDDAGRLLGSMDLRNDQLVKKALGFINTNAGFEIPRVTGTLTFPFTNFALRPAGWFCSNSASPGALPFYPTWVIGTTDFFDECEIPVGQIMSSHAIRINVETRYELAGLFKAISGNSTIALYIDEYDTDLLGQVDQYIGQAGGETGLVTRTRNLAGNTPQSVTTTYTLVKSLVYVPTPTAKWFSIAVQPTVNAARADWFGVRTVSTYGAISNDNIKGEIFQKEDFGINDLARVLALFNEIVVTGNDLSMVSTTTPFGPFALRVGNNSGDDGFWRSVSRRRAMPIVKNKVYRVSFWIRRNSGAGTAFLGVTGWKGDVYNGGGSGADTVGGTVINSNQHYFALNGVMPAGTSFNFYEAYFMNDGVAYDNAPAGTMYAPKKLHQLVEYVTPLMILNYSGAAGEIDVGYIELIAIDNAPVNVFSTSGDAVVGFNVDGSSNYQPKRTDAWYYTYDAGGTYKHTNGGNASDPGWILNTVTFFKGNVKYRDFTFVHLQNYGSESSSSRVGAAYARSYWRSSSGPGADSEFTVTMASVSKNKWAGTQHTSGSTYDVILSTEYGGSTGSYDIVITHTATGQKITLKVINTGVVTAGLIDVGK